MRKFTVVLAALVLTGLTGGAALAAVDATPAQGAAATSAVHATPVKHKTLRHKAKAKTKHNKAAGASSQQAPAPGTH
jgi:hypothetical protein